MSALAVTACQMQKSSHPLSPSVAGPIPGVSITTPALVTPAAGARIASDQQPITLTVNNAVSSGVRPISYLFEVASDAGFGTIVVSKADVKPDASGKTSFKLTTTLPDKTYFWRARAQDGANTGAYASPASFTVFTPVIIQAPVLVGPLNGTTLTTLTPKLTFSNSLRSGPAGTITYSVAVFGDPVSSSTLLWGSWTTTEGNAQTSVDVPAGVLAADKVYHWAVRASDGTTDSQWSEILAFRTPPATGRGGALLSTYRKADLDANDGRDWEHGARPHDAISDSEMWASLKWFYERILPVAEESGVRVCLHQIGRAHV